MNVLFEEGGGTQSFCIFNIEERDGRGCAFTPPFLAPLRRERAQAPTLAGEEKSADGLQQRLTGKNDPSAALHHRRRRPQKSCERTRNKRGPEFAPPLKLVSEDYYLKKTTTPRVINKKN